MKKFINNFRALDYINIFIMLSNNIFSIKITKNIKFYKYIKQLDI